MSEELLERARSDRALQEALRTSVEMAALAWEDEAGEAEDLARQARDAGSLMLARTSTAALMATPNMDDDESPTESDPGVIAAAALFMAASEMNELLLALLQLSVARSQSDLREGLRAELLQAIDTWRGDQLTVGPRNLDAQQMARANELYRERIATLCERARDALGSSAG